MSHTNSAFDDLSINFHNADTSVSGINLEGNIESAKLLSEDSTIDEPICDTITRDLLSVWKKIKYVLMPSRIRDPPNDWDLWGPFFIFIAVSMMMQLNKKGGENSGAPEFAQIFTLFWLGAFAASINIKLLGGTMSFLQTVCILGYCILPLVTSLVVSCLVRLFITGQGSLFVVRLILVLLGFAYSIFSCCMFIRPRQLTGRVALAVYPICLFYFCIGWMIFLSPSI